MISDLYLPSVFPNGGTHFSDQESEIVYPFPKFNLIYKVKKKINI